MPKDENAPTRNLTRSPGTRERFPQISPDGMKVAFFSDRSGEYQLGAPVTLRGFRIGSVSAFWLEYDLDRHTFHTTVVADMLTNITPTGRVETMRKFEELRGESVEKLREEFLTRMVAEGLRAQLAVQSFVTGMLQVELDFHADAERAELLQTPDGGWEVPTIHSSMGQHVPPPPKAPKTRPRCPPPSLAQRPWHPLDPASYLGYRAYGS
ncbi:MAG: hypothetical protein AB1486_22360 [Planctomycetota bacterium]